MANLPRISVVVASFGRARLLRRCLIALSQLHYPRFEVIVVADADGLALARQLPFADRLCLVAQDKPNISIARNLGIAQAAGDIVAFIDDDSVPEPTWLKAIADVMQDPAVTAATGVVLGRNGISVQWGQMAVDGFGRDARLEPGAALETGQVLKLHGTNMAIRRACFEAIGGFDPAFAFYLDDTDFALRLGAAGAVTRFAKRAVVHHGFAASDRRTEARVPLSLFDIGASTAAFLRKHAPEADHGILTRQLEADQRARLMRLARRRMLEPPEIRRLMESLMEGLAEGQTRALAAPEIKAPTRAFETLRQGSSPQMLALFGWWLRAPQLRAEAAEEVAAGHAVTLFLFEPTPRKHKVVFTEGGWWEQYGGLFGPTERTEPRLQPWRFAARAKNEHKRASILRGFNLL